MENEKVKEDLCRLCDEIGEKMYSIYDKNPDGQQILHLIKDCLPIMIYRTDPLSKQICEKCFNNLDIVHRFKKTSVATSEKHKEQLRTMLDQDGNSNKDIKMFLGCGEELIEGSDLKDVSTFTDDLTILCRNCQQNTLDFSMRNSEFELCADINEALDKKAENEKMLRKRKVVPFYNELDDSLCSSMTEFTQNTEGSRCTDMPSDTDESVDSEERPRKRPKIDYEEVINKNTEEKVNFKEIFKNEEEYRYEPLSLLKLCLNFVNRKNVPDYDSHYFSMRLLLPTCKYCSEKFRNTKLLALHESGHMEVELGEKIDNPTLWQESRPGADVRNKWLAYFDENGYEDEDIIIPEAPTDLLIPKQETKDGEEVITLEGAQPMVNGIYLGDYSKEERKSFYQTMKIQGVNKKFCNLCRYSFKDNWAIESHYFSLACYYTCRYCGMRFNKQRHKYQEHLDEHQSHNDKMSIKIFAASKLSNIVPRVINPQRVAASKEKAESQTSNAPLPFSDLQPAKVRNPPEKTGFTSNNSNTEPGMITSQSKTANQAYFCRKCYKVFFKLDEFNVHSKSCDYNQFPQKNSPKSLLSTSPKNGEAARTKSKDDSLKTLESTPQTFVCFVCCTPFPTVYSRNSHMRIHKGEQSTIPQSTHRTRFQTNLTAEKSREMNETLIKQEPPDEAMEPMVEIHEPEGTDTTLFQGSLGGGAVSITPISRNPKQKPMIDPHIMKIVQSNPNLSIKKASPDKYDKSTAPGGSGQHLSNSSLDDKSYKCSSCWEAFANKSHLYFHKKNHCEGSRFPCPFCKKRFGTEAAYSSHIFYSHPE